MYRPEGRIFRISIPRLLFYYIIAHVLLAVVFSSFYYLSKGVHETVYVDGEIQEKEVEGFLDYLHFSLTTQTTLGYGDLSPVKILTRVFSAFQTLFGLILNAIALGLILSKFLRRDPKLELAKKIAYHPKEKLLYFRIWNRDADHYVKLNIDANITRRVKMGVHPYEAFKTFPLSIHFNVPFEFYSNVIGFFTTNSPGGEPKETPELNEHYENMTTIASLTPKDELNVLVTAISSLRGDHVVVPYSYEIDDIECGIFYNIKPYKSQGKRGPTEYANFGKIEKTNVEDCQKCEVLTCCPLSQADAARKFMSQEFKSVSKPEPC